MNKVMKSPQELEHMFCQFRDEFTAPSYESMTQLAGAVICSENRRNVSGLHKNILGGKSRTAYEYFFHDAKWDEDLIAQRKADYFFSQHDVGPGNRLYLSIDDTLVEKKGDETEGVGKFYDHSEKRYINGNNFVTSCIQFGEDYIPHKSKMYLKEEAAEAMGEEFRTKLEIAHDEMIEPLELPERVELYVLFDCGYYSKDLLKDIKDLGHEAVCKLRKDKKIVVNGKETNVCSLADDLNYDRIDIEVRGREKNYNVSGRKVEIPELGEVKLVVSKTEHDEKDPHYLISTDLNLSSEEIVKIYENRWNIETAHREANQKFGFKEYQMRDKEAIERFMQLTFLVWTVIKFALASGKDFEEVVEEMKIGDMLDVVKLLYLIEMVMAVRKIWRASDSREELVERLADLLWN